MGVVLYHLGANWLPGGFTGVDVFFVISGFLISRGFYAEIDSPFKIVVLRFYQRRMRRILPAMTATILLTLVIGPLLLQPQNNLSLAKSAVAAWLFVANIYYWFSVDYFTASSQQWPLLHLWSLGIEEQFYVFWPLLVYFLTKRSLAINSMIIACLFIGSLSWCLFLLQSDPSAAFYWLPARAYELLVGCFLAVPGRRIARSGVPATLATMSGLALVFGGMLFIDKDGYAFPGLTALVPVTGTFLVLWGSNANKNTFARFLGSPAPVFCGKISYSLYLAHWPVISFGKVLFPTSSPAAFMIGGLTVSFALACLSYYFVERPFRYSHSGSIASSIRKLMAGALLLAVIAAILTVRDQRWGSSEEKDTTAVADWINFDPLKMFRSGRCFLDPDQNAAAFVLADCLPAKRPIVVLWGDSHLAQLYDGLINPLSANGIALGQLTASACPPLLGLDIPIRAHCRSVNDFAMQQLLLLKPELVVLGGARIETTRQIEALAETVRRLTSARIRVLVLGRFPMYTRPIPLIVAERLREGRDTLSGDDLDKTVFDVDGRLRKVSTAWKSSEYLSILELMCPAKQCQMMTEGSPVGFDGEHLTPAGSRYFGHALVPYISRMAIKTIAN